MSKHTHNPTPLEVEQAKRNINAKKQAKAEMSGEIMLFWVAVIVIVSVLAGGVVLVGGILVGIALGARAAFLYLNDLRQKKERLSTANTMLSQAKPPIELSPEQKTLLQKSRNPERCAQIILLTGLKSPISKETFENICKRPKNIETALKKIQALGLKYKIQNLGVETLQNPRTYAKNLTKINQYLKENSSEEHIQMFSLHPPSFEGSKEMVDIMNDSQFNKTQKLELIEALNNRQIPSVHLPSSRRLSVDTVFSSTAPTEGVARVSNRPKTN